MAESVTNLNPSAGIAIGVRERTVAAVTSLALGIFLVWGAGLANSAALHDTAHDTRHSYGFPCH